MQTGDHGAISPTGSLFLPLAAFDVVLLFTSSAHGARPNLERYPFMEYRSAGTLALAVAFAGLLDGTTARLNAQPSQQGTPNASASSNPAC